MTTEDTTTTQRPPQSDEERAAVDYLLHLHQLEEEGELTAFSIGPRSLFEMIAALQLALRHPHISGTMRDRLLQVTRQLATVYDGTLGEQIIAKGYNPEFDMTTVRAGVPTFGEWFADEYTPNDDDHAEIYTLTDMRNAYYAGTTASDAGRPDDAPAV